MKNIKQAKKLNWVFAAVVAALSTLAVVPNAYSYGYKHKYFDVTPAIKTPSGTADDGYIVFVANGRFQSADGSFMKDGIVGGDGVDFQKNIMGRSDSEIADLESQAIEFFANRFGVDVENNPDIIFTGYEVDPGINLRAYTVAGQSVPSSGWHVDDGGWAVFVVNPEGITLGGAWEGFHLPANSALFFGDYKINGTDKFGRDKDIVIHYESDIPFIMGQFGAGQIRCKTDSDKYGVGAAGGAARFTILNDDLLMQVDAKNIITFPGVQSGI